MTAPMEILCEFSTRSESRSSQSSYSEYFMTFDQYLSQLELFLNNQKHDMLGTLIRFDPSTYTPTKNLRKSTQIRNKTLSKTASGFYCSNLSQPSIKSESSCWSSRLGTYHFMIRSSSFITWNVGGWESLL